VLLAKLQRAYWAEASILYAFIMTLVKLILLIVKFTKIVHRLEGLGNNNKVTTKKVNVIKYIGACPEVKKYKTYKYVSMYSIIHL